MFSARISVRYGNKPDVLHEVTLEIQQGEVVGLVGQSGSGKSTLAMAILGLLDRKRARTEGTIEFDGSALLRFASANCAIYADEKLRWCCRVRCRL